MPNEAILAAIYVIGASPPFGYGTLKTIFAEIKNINTAITIGINIYIILSSS